jgi:predicted nucleic acid-binding protein
LNIIVSNTGPLISLEHLSGGFDFLRKLYSKIIIPPAVLQEVSVRYDSPEKFFEAHRISDFLTVQSPKVLLNDIPLHAGEIAAISLAYEQQLPLLIEEYDGRQAAQDKGLQISGIAGQIFKAHDQRTISTREAVTFMDQLLDAHRINSTIHQAIIDRML